MRHVLVFGAWVTAIYLAGAFVAMELNVAEWHIHGRFMALMALIIGTGFTYSKLERQDKESEK